MELIKPHAAYKKSFCEALAGFNRDGTTGFWNVWGKEIGEENVEEYIINTGFFEIWKKLPEWRVPSTTYRLVEEDSKTFLWCINVRHTLTNFLFRFAWHVWYAISPTERGKWYGTTLLAMTLPRIKKEIGLNKVLLTCDETNIASKKIIEKNGWVYENSEITEEWVVKLRYWIEL